MSAEQFVQKDEIASMAELEAFAGNANYPKEWAGYHEKKSKTAGFNGWAAIFGLQWFFYRRLYKQGLIAFMFQACATVGFIIFFRLILDAHSMQEYGRAISYGAAVLYFLIQIGIGYWANIALYKQAVVTIQKINQFNLDNERHLEVVKSLGQPSFQSVLFLYLGVAILKIGLGIVH